MRAGAVAYALSEYLSKINPSDSVETGTLVIVVLSTIIFGGATGPLMRKLGLQARISKKPPLVTQLVHFRELMIMS